MELDMKTLLIVDDEDAIHRALRRTFRREPYKLLHAFDAAEAWVILGAHPEVAAVICDHYMPGTPGLDLLMDARTRYRNLKTVLLTAQADLKLVMAAINEGQIHRFFTKPWDAADLRAQIRELVSTSEDGWKAADADQSAVMEARMREALLPQRDGETGAFILEDPNGS